MTWEVIEKRPSGHDPARLSGIFVSSVMMGRDKSACIIRVTWRATKPAWFEPKKTVSVARGSGEDAGLLRIAPGAGFLIGRAGSEGPNCARMVRFGAWNGIAAAHNPESCEYRLDGDSVIVTLPEWARGDALPAASGPASPARPLADAFAAPKPAPPAAPKPAPPVLTTPPAARPVVDALTAAHGAPVKASREAIQQWGETRGIITRQLDLERVNKKRRDLGLVPFEVEMPARAGAR